MQTASTVRIETEDVVARSDEELLDLMRERYIIAPDDLLDRFLEGFQARHGAGLRAVILYGSRLWASTHSPSSLLDFFLVADDYADFHARQRDSILNRFLAPSTYLLKVGEERCKYNSVSLQDLRREVSPGARDLFHAGRLSKRVGLLWTRDEQTREEILRICLAAMKRVIPLALGRLGTTFTFEEFLLGVLGVSYAAEIRVEADSKVAKLLEAEEPFYRAIYGALLTRYARSDPGLSYDGAGDVWIQSPEAATRERERGEALLQRSRLRMYARWFKYMATLDGWTDLLVEKVERTKGIKLELSPLQRRYPYIFGWSHFLRFLRQGIVK